MGEESSSCTWISCKAGSYLDNTKGCVPCAIGQFSGAGAKACSKCPINEYSDKAGSAKCTPCPKGKEAKTEGSSSCTWISCKAGNYLDKTKGCVPCAIGEFSGDGAVKCSKCPKNEYSDKAGSAKCEKCPIGKETKAEGSKSCTWIACAPGQELNKEIGCVTCAARKYSTDGIKCVSCPDGKYSKEGSTKKDACSCYWSGWKFPNQMDPFVTDNLEDCAKACTKA